ncbi:hypothetical protein [Streptomyces sp. NBC_01803]|uniref:hypothetical protein n=1 Tax=Streptomyces sp. NBC_01803 TaxID=2975946 RepID=UPI002DDA49E0|nr:hypothetical protein [Streptomyces sp. NBC_01803]WSA45936.1 hypothetical protein OIE51_18065 [Streptomyces sp. NBC_01803]
MTDLLPLAAKELNEYTVTPGVLGFIVFAVLGLGVWLLLKSMSKHLRRIAVLEAQEQQGVPAGAGREGERGSSRS